MKKEDVVFRLIPGNEMANPNSYCYYGWEGIGAFAFWRYATAYYESAEVLFEKFKASAGHNDILDNTGITMCFLYRHFVELTIKHLYVLFVCKSKDDYKLFLKKGHHLVDLWNLTKPTLSSLKKRVGSSVDLGVLEHYIKEIDRFDPDSMMMRYPVSKDLKPLHESSRLDIFNLHDRMVELYWAFVGLSNDLDNQFLDDVEQNKIDDFLKKYEELRPRVFWLLEAMKPFADKENNEFDFFSFSEIKPQVENGIAAMELLLKCTDDELIMFDTLYYTGRAIKCGQLRLPKSPYEAKNDVAKMCVFNMEHDGLSFGKPKNNSVMIWQKASSSIIAYISAVIAVIDWGK